MLSGDNQSLGITVSGYFLLSAGNTVTVSGSPTSPPKWWNKDLVLTQEDQDALLKNGWQSDKHMCAAARMLKSEIKGFQSTPSGRYVSVHSSPACQFHHRQHSHSL